jgi:transcriptional regulator with XRE-family HTH domain
MSRVSLARRLGISPKTIQSWEMGRTFIERLEIIPVLEAELGCSLSAFIGKATGAAADFEAGIRHPEGESEAFKPGMATHHKLATRMGPLAPVFNVVLEKGELKEGDVAKLAAVPLVKPSALMQPISAIKAGEIIRHIIIPREWIPRAGVVAAVRMGDSAMMPMIPLGSLVAINLQVASPEKLLGKIAAIAFSVRGLRIRRVVRDMAGEGIYGASVTEHSRAKLPISQDRGDRILGVVIGVLAAV